LLFRTSARNASYFKIPFHLTGTSSLRSRSGRQVGVCKKVFPLGFTRDFLPRSKIPNSHRRAPGVGFFFFFFLCFFFFFFVLCFPLGGTFFFRLQAFLLSRSQLRCFFFLSFLRLRRAPLQSVFLRKTSHRVPPFPI